MTTTARLQAIIQQTGGKEAAAELLEMAVGLEAITEQSELLAKATKRVNSSFTSLKKRNDQLRQSLGQLGEITSSGELGGNLEGLAKSSDKARDGFTKLRNESRTIEGNLKQLGTVQDGMAKKFQSGAAKIAGASKKVKEAQDKSLKALVANNEEVTKAIAKLKKYAGPVGLGLAIIGLTKMSAGIAITNSALSKQADALGVAVEEFTGLNAAFVRGGVASAEFTNILSKLDRKVGEAKTGVGEAAAIFDSLGIDPRTITDAVDGLDKVTQSFGRMGPGAERSALAAKLFEEQFAKVIGVLEDGGNDIDGMIERSRELGQVLDKDAAQSSRDFEAALSDLKGLVKGVSQGVAGFFIPALTGAAKWAIETADAVGLVTRAMSDLLIGSTAVTKALETGTAVELANTRAQILQAESALQIYMDAIDDAVIAIEREEKAFEQNSKRIEENNKALRDAKRNAEDVRIELDRLTKAEQDLLVEMGFLPPVVEELGTKSEGTATKIGNLTKNIVNFNREMREFSTLVLEGAESPFLQDEDSNGGELLDLTEILAKRRAIWEEHRDKQKEAQEVWLAEQVKFQQQQIANAQSVVDGFIAATNLAYEIAGAAGGEEAQRAQKAIRVTQAVVQSLAAVGMAIAAAAEVQGAASRTGQIASMAALATEATIAGAATSVASYGAAPAIGAPAFAGAMGIMAASIGAVVPVVAALTAAGTANQGFLEGTSLARELRTGRENRMRFFRDGEATVTEGEGRGLGKLINEARAGLRGGGGGRTDVHLRVEASPMFRVMMVDVINDAARNGDLTGVQEMIPLAG